MQKIKGEFVEYVKDILTKTTSQVTNQSSSGAAAGKQRQSKVSQMSVIEELTN